MSHDHGSMDMGGMDMGGDSSSGMSHSMAMTFHSNMVDALFSDQWVPSNRGQYAGTCIFIVFFAMIYRGLFVVKFKLDEKLIKCGKLNKQVVALTDIGRDQPYKSLRDIEDELDEEEEQERLQKLERPEQPSPAPTMTTRQGPRPWRLSVDVPRAAIQTVLSGVGYLLMLITMTYNVGYFVSVLGGIFLGELLFARYAS